MPRPLSSCYVKPCATGTTSQKRKKRRRRKKRGKASTSIVPFPSSRRAAIAKATRVINDRLNCSCANELPAIYDANSLKVIRSKIVTKQVLSTANTTNGNDGQAAVKIAPTLHDHIATAETFGTSVNSTRVIAWNNIIDADGYASMEESFSSYRLVSMCVEYTSWAAPTDSSGVLTFVVSPPKAASYHSDGTVAGDTWQLDSTLADNVEFIRQYQSDVCVCTATESGEANVFKPFDSTSPDGWPYVYVGLRGGTSTAGTVVGEVTVTMCIEAHVETDTIFNQYLQPAAPHIPQLEAAIQTAASDMPKIVDNSTDGSTAKRTFWDAAEDAAVKLVDSLTPVALAEMMALL